MKVALVYYSMSGNTEFAAEKIKNVMTEKASAANGGEGLTGGFSIDLIKIEPEKAYPDKGAKKFLFGGKAAVMGEKPVLKEYNFDPSKYDTIIIGSPVWAGTMAPPIRSFVTNRWSDIMNKQLGIFTCASGNGGYKAVEKIRDLIGVRKLKFCMSLIDPKEKQTHSNDLEIDRFCNSMLF